mmetsp:Transcript_10746/g.16849  ORF Transcript_10746/g.16849 Transcript_10746/m.16849 type:complete len:174 (-) Transcript_10746:703-1224(-)
MCGVAARLRRPSLAVLGISGVVLIWLSSIAGSEAKTVRGKTQAFVEGQNECKQMNCYTALNNAPKTRWKGNRGNTRYLGSFHSVSDCESACLSYKDRRGRRCQSFVYHDKELSKMCFSKRKCFDSQCFAVLNNFWVRTLICHSPRIQVCKSFIVQGNPIVPTVTSSNGARHYW